MKIWSRLRALWHLSGKRAFYAGAAVNRLTGDFLGSMVSAKRALESDLRTLRHRSRQLERNNPMVRRYLDLCEEAVVGPVAPRLQVRGVDAKGKPTKTTNSAIESAFREWSAPDLCSVDHRMGFGAFLRSVVRQRARDGEVFIRIVKGFPNRFGVALQLLDPDLFDETYKEAGRANQAHIHSSIEFDSWGRPLAYHMWNGYPDESTDRRRIRIPADEVIHWFKPRRAGQVRGEPDLVGVMLALQHLEGYVEAELVAARTAAAKMGFIEQSEDAAGPDPEAPQSRPLEADPGVIGALNPGEKFVAWDPTHPAGNFGPFLTALHHHIAMGLSVAHASLTGNYSDVNYSSGRLGRLAEQDHFRVEQNDLEDSVCRPIYLAWLRMAALANAVALPSADLSRYSQHEWQSRGFDYVDPDKDVEAAAKAVAYGFDTYRRQLAERGIDFDDFLEARREEVAAIAAAGLTFATPGAKPATPPDANTTTSGPPTRMQVVRMAT